MDCGKVGALIGRLRRERGLTQRELAGRLLVSDKAVSKWERGAGCPDVSLLAPLAERAFVLRPDSPRAMDPAALCALLAKRGVEARPCVSVEEGLNAALAVGEAICALGSLYLCGEVRAAYTGKFPPPGTCR